MAAAPLLAATPEFDFTTLAAKVRSAVLFNRLTTLVSDCFVVPRTEMGQEEAPGAVEFDVGEVHNAKFGADPATDRRRMFGVRVIRRTGALSSDAKSRTGDYLPLRRQRGA
jgi:hypothetical protein